jgi:mRNA interferase MazF
MAIQFNPTQGTVLVCDFNTGFVEPEMVKRRPVVVVSPRLRTRERLCTVVPLSTTDPVVVAPYHYRICIDPPLPSPYDAKFHWVKADMIYTVSFGRLHCMFDGKDPASGKRNYDIRVIEREDLLKIQQCMLHAVGLSHLTSHL